ncbi:translation initiation factor eIF-2A [Aureobasidium pullulans]|uniref:Eukaryotic translation initiation factor 2A n=1 Tax=Aureobasidium pullulans TaxID=5580 RepID=A0AB74IXK6_AURPU|nr:translation initiation factor eIF-2A [Aureobasidium pullulans]THX75307.1 translation initiation factor eIF-2A [Aureobasidium pullulans]
MLKPDMAADIGLWQIVHGTKKQKTEPKRDYISALWSEYKLHLSPRNSDLCLPTRRLAIAYAALADSSTNKLLQPVALISTMAQPTQLAYRTAKGVGILNAAPAYEALPGFTRPEGNLRCCVYSPDGRFFAWASPDQVTVVDAAQGHTITTLPTQNVFELGFSPLGTYIITWQRPTKDENGDAVKNLKVWRTVDDEATRQVVGQFVQKNQTGWNLQYTLDEEFCARAVTNEVHFYKTSDLGTVHNKLRVEGVQDFALSKGRNANIAVFVPERKGMPAQVKVFNVPHFTSPVSQKTFFKADKVQLKWNNEGTSLIVLAQTDVDKTNKSYYGETNMYILSSSGAFDSRITLDKDGPIHDVSWSPNSKEFGVVYGYMPAKTTIFNQRAVAQHSFSLGPRNTIIFSPHGRFVIVAGFGNLAGTMDIYDMEKNYQKVSTIEASNASICEWSPDGQHILTATTSPRLRVDNGIRMWHVSGSFLYNEEMSELYHVTWRPEPIEKHPLGNPLANVPAPHSSAAAHLATKKAPSKPVGAYRPPGARGSSTPLHFKREDEGGAAFINQGISSANIGANGFGSRPRRREQRRERSRSKSGQHGPVRGQSHRGDAPATPAKQAPAAPAPAPEVTVSSPAVESTQDKKIRALLKKLRAIDDLKMRQAGGEKLENTQVSKISTEEGVRKELSALGYNE